jgi:hypothetical protein
MRADRGHAAAPRPGERGFMLVGVVMFIVVLTILGLSLFSLSGFESQFLERSLDRQRAFYAATGGIERAKYALLVNKNKGDVKNGMSDGVILATAWQHPDKADSGAALETNQVVTVRVVADVNGQRELVESRFLYTEPTQLYKRLLTLSGGLLLYAMNDDTPPASVLGTTRLSGHVWSNQPLTNLGYLDPIGTNLTVDNPGGTVPTPDAPGFIAQHINDPGIGDFDDFGSGVISLATGNDADISYFRTQTTSPHATHDIDGNGTPDYSFFTSSSNTRIVLSGTGTAICLFPHGVRFDPLFEVEGDPRAMLVIVAGDNLSTAEPNQGVILYGGSTSALTQGSALAGPGVILVSEKDVTIKHFKENLDLGSTTPYLSIFARNAQLYGPRSSALPPQDLTLTHMQGDFRDVPHGRIDWLVSQHVLPNATGEVGSLALQHGTWRQITATIPD